MQGSAYGMAARAPFLKVAPFILLFIICSVDGCNWIHKIVKSFTSCNFR